MWKLFWEVDTSTVKSTWSFPKWPGSGRWIAYGRVSWPSHSYMMFQCNEE
jgi:hypothetical protein